MHGRRNKGEEGSARGRDAPRRRKGGDKCQLLFEKPHALAPAWHVAGACVCESRRLLLLPLSKWPRMFRLLARWVSRIFHSCSKKSPLVSPFDPSLTKPRATESELLFTARLLSDRDFNDFSLGPFTSVQDQINALLLFAIDRTTTGHRLHIAISSSSSSRCFLRAWPLRFVLSQTRRAARKLSIEPSSSDLVLLIQTSRRPFSRARLESGSAISKYLLASRVNRERIGERGTVLTVGCTSIPHVLWNRFPMYRFPI